MKSRRCAHTHQLPGAEVWGGVWDTGQGRLRPEALGSSRRAVQSTGGGYWGQRAACIMERPMPHQRLQGAIPTAGSRQDTAWSLMRAVPHTTNARWDCNGVTVGLPPSCPTSLHAPAIITAGISCIRRFFWKLETATPQVTVAFIAPKAKKAGLLFVGDVIKADCSSDSTAGGSFGPSGGAAPPRCAMRRGAHPGRTAMRPAGAETTDGVNAAMVAIHRSQTSGSAWPRGIIASDHWGLGVW
eukprot:CAMPEP_0174315556 /NCGR_PEP_ID=MMETSP0810-20121108/6361_1 /TAXON_ID=73025 ORGANISM="Eutreptiella gymnastica-like, Strain CCMP1594" /NCGR_SAMPLE_ID=MMETSP0810 /ASSEMBLY_ACC=CAM_ASM_000659 /LENGTH=241 /DNA_ID=CAMNT_0015424973 /DNA_START=1730 /DNA_END=2454 /DNA_ORIENTATION=+